MEYLENLPVIADIDLDVLFEQLSKGEKSAVQTLASYYMKATAELAADMNAKEILLGRFDPGGKSEPDPGAGQCR